MSELDTPFYQALAAYCRSGTTPLHMPGHKGGRGFPAPELAAVGSIDYTEVPELDDWHRPEGALARAQELMARAYGAMRSYFLVNGATAGIHALFMALGEGAEVILPRNGHRSFYGGMVLSGARPHYMESRLDEEWGLPLVTGSDEVNAALSSYPEARAVFVVSPTYFGTCSPLTAIAEAVHLQGRLLMVDEAHGAHFGFHPAYPPGALAQGADAVVHGMHKTLPALTGSGCLHLGRDFPGAEQVFPALDLLITTSPSQPLLASLDWARAWVTSREGYQGLERMADLASEFDHQIESIPGLTRIRSAGGAKANDPGRVAVGISGLGISGWEMETVLRDEFALQVEMSGENYVLAIFTPFNTREEWQRLARALSIIAARYPGRKKKVPRLAPPSPRVVLKPREAHFAVRRRVRLQDATGLVSGELVALYPPGIPCLLPGEIITGEIVEYIGFLRQNGARIQGMLDPEAEDIYVIDM